MQQGSTNQVAASRAFAGAVEPSSTAATAYKRVLMGGGKQDMNLANVRARAEELQRSLDQIAHGLQYNAHMITWTDTLDKFAVLNVQYFKLLQQLRPLLKTQVVYPKSVNQQNAPILPVMLATKQLPEMDAEEAELLSEHQAAMGALTPQAQYQALMKEMDDFNKLVDDLTILSSPGTGVLDPKSPLRKDLAAVSKAPSQTASAPPQLKRQSSGRGKRPRDASDYVLAALLRGEGLRK